MVTRDKPPGLEVGVGIEDLDSPDVTKIEYERAKRASWDMNNKLSKFKSRPKNSKQAMSIGEICVNDEYSSNDENRTICKTNVIGSDEDCISSNEIKIQECKSEGFINTLDEKAFVAESGEPIHKKPKKFDKKRVHKDPSIEELYYKNDDSSESESDEEDHKSEEQGNDNKPKQEITQSDNNNTNIIVQPMVIDDIVADSPVLDNNSKVAFVELT